MEGIEGKHAEYADDTNVWSSHKNIIEARESTIRDLNLRVKPWCRKWNTGQPRYLKVQGNEENTSSYPKFDIAKM